MQKGSRKNNIVEAIIIVILLLLIVFSFVINAFFYKDKEAPLFMNKYYIYVTGDENTVQGINPKTAAICDRTLTENIQVGNVVLAIINEDNDKALMRIAELDDKTCKLKSDSSDDTILINRKNVIGFCTNLSTGFGKFVTFATASQGIVLLIVLPCTIIVLIQALRILDKDDSEENESEKERKLKEKKAKEDAKRNKLISESKSDEEEEDKIYLIGKDENGKASAVPADEAEEQMESIAQRIARKKAEKLRAEKEARENKEEKIVESPVPVIEDKTVQIAPVVEDKTIQMTKEPIVEDKTVQMTKEPVAEDKTIKINNVEENIVDTIQSETELSQFAKPYRPKAEREIKEDFKPVKKKSSSSTKYSANKYATRRSSKTSVDDLLKTIDNEKSKIHK